MSVIKRWVIWTCPTCGAQRERPGSKCPGCPEGVRAQRTVVVPAEQLRGAVSRAEAAEKRVRELLAAYAVRVAATEPKAREITFLDDVGWQYLTGAQDDAC